MRRADTFTADLFAEPEMVQNMHILPTVKDSLTIPHFDHIGEITGMIVPGTVFTVGRTRLEFRVEKVQGDAVVVRGESGRKRTLPRDDVIRRLEAR